MSNSDRFSRCRGLKIFYGVSAIVLFVLIIIVIILLFTIFKIRQPEIIALPTGLKNVNFTFFPTLAVNATIDMVVAIHNRNYGSFKYKNSTAYVDFHRETVAEVPIEPGLVMAKGTLNITTSTVVMGHKLVENKFFLSDFGTGCLNFTSTATYMGECAQNHQDACNSC